MNLIEKWADDREVIRQGDCDSDSDLMAAECYDALKDAQEDIEYKKTAIAHYEISLEESTNQYHLAQAKILSRDALIEQLSETQLAKDVAEAETRIERLDAVYEAAMGYVNNDDQNYIALCGALKDAE